MTNCHSLPRTEGFLEHWNFNAKTRTAAAKPLQSCPTLSDPMDCSPPGSSIHGIFQARVLEWGAIAFSENQNSPRQIQTVHVTLGYALGQRDLEHFLKEMCRV